MLTTLILCLRLFCGLKENFIMVRVRNLFPLVKLRNKLNRMFYYVYDNFENYLLKKVVPE